ncbi:MAG: CPBP family intramembrane metalloprotease [Chloroflexi bacterium]|nr:CPBP family intramembrane metalloprotease [Chloroflexota bacterium]
MKSWPVARGTAPPPPETRDDPARAPWGITEILVVLLIALVLLLIISLVNGLLLSAFGIDQEGATGDELGGTMLLMGQALLDFVIIGTAAYFSLRKYRLSPRAWGLRREKPIQIVACVGVLLASFAVLTGYGVVTQVLGLDALEPKNNVPEGFFAHRSVLPFTVFLVLLVAPTMEEMFFRGFLFGGFRRHLGMIGGAAVSGLLFGSIHINGADTIGLVIPFSIIGFMFAMLVGRTGSLWNAILVHFAFNLIGFVGNLTSGAILR